MPMILRRRELIPVSLAACLLAANAARAGAQSFAADVAPALDAAAANPAAAIGTALALGAVAAPSLSPAAAASLAPAAPLPAPDAIAPLARLEARAPAPRIRAAALSVARTAADPNIAALRDPGGAAGQGRALDGLYLGGSRAAADPESGAQAPAEEAGASRSGLRPAAPKAAAEAPAVPAPGDRSHAIRNGADALAALAGAGVAGAAYWSIGHVETHLALLIAITFAPVMVAVAGLIHEAGGRLADRARAKSGR